jgi:hypothetical protein
MLDRDPSRVKVEGIARREVNPPCKWPAEPIFLGVAM